MSKLFWRGSLQWRWLHLLFFIKFYWLMLLLSKVSYTGSWEPLVYINNNFKPYIVMTWVWSWHMNLIICLVVYIARLKGVLSAILIFNMEIKCKVFHIFAIGLGYCSLVVLRVPSLFSLMALRQKHAMIGMLNFKFQQALGETGHSVSLFCTTPTLSQNEINIPKIYFI